MPSARPRKSHVEIYSFILPLTVSTGMLAVEFIKGLWYAHSYLRLLLNMRVWFLKSLLLQLIQNYIENMVYYIICFAII